MKIFVFRSTRCKYSPKCLNCQLAKRRKVVNGREIPGWCSSASNKLWFMPVCQKSGHGTRLPKGHGGTNYKKQCLAHWYCIPLILDRKKNGPNTKPGVRLVHIIIISYPSIPLCHTSIFSHGKQPVVYLPSHLMYYIRSRGFWLQHNSLLPLCLYIYGSKRKRIQEAGFIGFFFHIYIYTYCVCVYI